jgi:cytochrome c
VWNKDLVTRQPVACAKKVKHTGAAKSGPNEERKNAMPQATAGQVSAQLAIGRATAASLLAMAGSVTAGYGADAELGRYLSSECMTCHGTAKPGSTIPNIFGLGEARFAEVLRAYRAKALPNPVMQTVAGRLNDEDIAALALYFETANRPK